MVQAARCRHCGQAHASSIARCPVTGARLGDGYTHVNEDEVLVGSVVADRYHVREVLGQGTNGTVFAVEHVVTGRPAAMKVLRPRYVAGDVLLRVFHGEARAAWSLPHPVLCEVFDAGQLPDGSPFFTMERLVGETLATRLQRERMSLGSGVDMMMQLLSALDAIHKRDLVVRDLRPQNIFLSFRRGCRPVAKILDFGLARLVPLDRVQEDWDALRSVIGGSDASGSLALPYYLSPERTRSEHGVGPASDLFVAGAIFYEALTGQKPFVSTSFNGLLLQIAQARPAPMTDFRTDIPEGLDALVQRTLSQQPQHRPQSAAELQDELRAVFERGRRGPASRTAIAAAPPVSGATSAAFAPPSVVGPVTPNAPMAPLTPPGAPSARVAAQPPASAAAGPTTSRSETRESSPSYSSIPVSSSIPVDGFLGASALRIPAAAPVPADPFEEETRTDRNVSDLLGPEVNAVLSGRETDEASAESPLRTVPPPAHDEIEVDVDVDAGEETTKTKKPIRDSAGRVKAADDDDETATMELTPEVRAKIDAMTKAARAAGRLDAPLEGPDGAPQTRRMK